MCRTRINRARVCFCASQSPMPKTILIPIPISKSSAPRFRNSVEGLNQEIERITIQDTPEKEETIVVSNYKIRVMVFLKIFCPTPKLSEIINIQGFTHHHCSGIKPPVERCYCDLICVCVFIRQPQDVPDGHRAPPPVPPQRSSSTRSIDTQTPSGGGLSGNHSNCSSRPDSISPSYLTVLNDMGGGSPYEDKGDHRTHPHTHAAYCTRANVPLRMICC